MTDGAIYAGASAGERREVRRRQLLSAAVTLIGEGGWAALSVRGVCAQASLTARYFYESFADREVLAAAVFDSVADAAVTRVLTAVDASPDTALDKARAAIGAVVDYVAAEPSAAIVLYAPADGLTSISARRIALTRRFAELVQQRGRDFYGLGPAGELATAATMLAGGLAQTLLDWTTGRLVVTRAALVEDCALMFVAAGEAAVARARAER